MTVDVRCGIMRGRPFARALAADAQALLKLCGIEESELSLMIIGDRAMRALNRRFRAKDNPTDVLSFSQVEDGEGAAERRIRRPGRRAGAPKAAPARMLGDVVISFDTAHRQARELKVTAAQRLRTLLIHGYLHLLGYDHERSASEARVMFALARKLEAALAPSQAGLARAPMARAPAPRKGARTAAADGRRRPRAGTRR